MKFTCANKNLSKKYVTGIIEKYQNQYTKYFLSKFNPQKICQTFDYYQYCRILQRNEKIKIKIIKQVLKKYHKFWKISKPIYFLHGSLSKHGARTTSDIDLDILFLKDYSKDVMVIEEIINVSLSQIFYYVGRDKVHTIMLYTLPPCKQKFKPDEKHYIEFANHDRLGFITRPHYENVYPQIYNSTRSYQDFVRYLNNTTFDHEWLISFLGLNMQSKKQLRKTIKNLYKHLSWPNFRQNVRQFLQKLTNNTDIFTLNTVSKLNNILKVQNMDLINTYLLFCSEYQYLQNKKIHLIDYRKLSKSFKVNVFQYLFFLERVEYLCLKENINFSSRNHDTLNMLEFTQKYENYYHNSLAQDYEILNTIKTNMKEGLKTWIK